MRWRELSAMGDDPRPRLVGSCAACACSRARCLRVSAVYVVVAVRLRVGIRNLVRFSLVSIACKAA